MAKVTIHRALSKKKIIPNEITRDKLSTPFAIANRKTNTKINGIAVADVEKNIQSAFTSIKDQFSNMEKTICAIALSNSTTKVSVGGKEYTVTEAIQLKSVFALKREILDLMKRDLRNAVTKVAGENETLAQRATEFAKSNTGDKSSGPAKPEALQGMIEVYTNANEYGMVDPLGLEKIIAEFEKEIVAFESDVDAVLSESNATTFIEI